MAERHQLVRRGQHRFGGIEIDPAVLGQRADIDGDAVRCANCQGTMFE
jgi:hypothetical protein